ncbi:hypothetical protein IQ257_04965 [Coleofasciculus sp. LEGE 07092]|uniref:hypothetical protein n=1 Tax=Coleofasciculus sp. LEGE 07081 TaxID=2777967 RepID=UPI001A0507D7|nr:hypothetical protein [Coleofasciculus sp. LEGE 07081]MBE9124882.1 hypothetical protein [Coleofasciculus sp. LEGE 07081]MBE9147874.1 hypothetical protein [Coleofasciculus sp. LEGE 07092]
MSVPVNGGSHRNALRPQQPLTDVDNAETDTPIRRCKAQKTTMKTVAATQKTSHS